MPGKLAWGLFSEKMCRIERTGPWNQLAAMSETVRPKSILPKSFFFLPPEEL